MENNNTKKIEEDIRQHKLYKIQVIEQKIRGYEATFNSIKENIIIKYTKNLSSNIIRLIFILITIFLIVSGINLLFPEHVISFMKKNGNTFSASEKDMLTKLLPYLGYIKILVSIPFAITAALLKKNIKKRNVIYDLSELVKDVIDYMKTDTKDEKKRYEHFVESIAELEGNKRRTAKNM